MDVQRGPGVPRAVQQQELRGPVGLLEVRHMGHHRSARLPECVPRRKETEPHRDGHHVLHYHPEENSFLHCQLDPPHGAHFISLRVSVLSASRGRRKSDTRNQYSPVTGCVPVACE